MKRTVGIAPTLAVFLCTFLPTCAVYAQDPAALKSEIDALRALVPSQSHAMMDVDYQFSNLWFAGTNENWPLAQFFLNETRSHLGWAVRIRPVRRLSNGGEFDLRPMLQDVERTALAGLRAAVERHDKAEFQQAYRRAMDACFACHQAAEKPYLRPRIPEQPSSRMIDFVPR
jgi:hypothetical protein